MESPKIEETLYRMNGTLMKDGDVGKALLRIADKLEKMNWNFGAIAKVLKEEQIARIKREGRE